MASTYSDAMEIFWNSRIYLFPPSSKLYLPHSVISLVKCPQAISFFPFQRSWPNEQQNSCGIFVKKAATILRLETTELEKKMYVRGPQFEMDEENSVLASLDPNEDSTFLAGFL